MFALHEQLKFSMYNDRPENAAEMNKLIVSFCNVGIISMKEIAAIPLIVDIKCIKNVNSLTKDFLDPGEVTELEMLDDESIIVASGQHRLIALVKYQQSVEDELASLTKKHDKIRDMGTLTEDHLEMYNTLQDIMGNHMELLETMGK
ncbi:uncharacterized protein F5147DRAFT_646966 [Suillus discolor]|uniref:Uncharacterized protein n=1 Tax=Suillus discolor TaxID=1912936 RepID=A0A9P7FK01_9AGAM|nr:uncharacterized protein F5147DRAFT_646966 [Suillus discolor]KAG2120461.1 hypothetical protein F5147DRAFT_646966 [Suillus discolor]